VYGRWSALPVSSPINGYDSILRSCLAGVRGDRACTYITSESVILLALEIIGRVNSKETCAHGSCVLTKLLVSCMYVLGLGLLLLCPFPCAAFRSVSVSRLYCFHVVQRPCVTCAWVLDFQISVFTGSASCRALCRHSLITR
jgi:hypothetical protein